MDDSLSPGRFYRGAQQAARKAMDDHARGEYDEFALHGGVAIERLAKAVLASKNPTYLVEMRNGNSDMLLYFGGHVEITLDKVRTVGASEAIKRLRRVGILPDDLRLDRLIELRNGTAHTTVGDQAKSLLPTLLTTVAILLEDLGRESVMFWGSWNSAVLGSIDTQRSDIERDVGLRIRQARHRFEDRFAGFPEAARARALEEPSAKPYPFDISHFRAPNEDHYYILATAECPACTGTAMLQMRPSRDLQNGNQMILESLHCPLCSLFLESAAEVEAANVKDPWKSEKRPQTMTVTGFSVPSSPERIAD
ncbi:hypothetical protein [Streptomyces sp. CH-036]|uniref:hypothetical protein n=1 Tax=Streptomyces sp. CH-036 TaxID=3406733 RepID=UPI003C75B463